jgi:hypothetical protein
VAPNPYGLYTHRLYAMLKDASVILIKNDTMRTYLFLIFIFGLSLNLFSQTKIVKPSFNPQVAVKFINDYIKIIDSRKTNTQEWIKNNQLLTNRFKAEYNKSVNGYSDPILDAQDYPDKGVKIIKSDSTSGYIILQGVDWENFLLTVKIELQDNKWLVEGSGIINIPENKRSKR